MLLILTFNINDLLREKITESFNDQHHSTRCRCYRITRAQTVATAHHSKSCSNLYNMQVYKLILLLLLQTCFSNYNLLKHHLQQLPRKKYRSLSSSSLVDIQLCHRSVSCAYDLYIDRAHKSTK